MSLLTANRTCLTFRNELSLFLAQSRWLVNIYHFALIIMLLYDTNSWIYVSRLPKGTHLLTVWNPSANMYGKNWLCFLFFLTIQSSWTKLEIFISFSSRLFRGKILCRTLKHKTDKSWSALGGGGKEEARHWECQPSLPPSSSPLPPTWEDLQASPRRSLFTVWNYLARWP